MKSLPLWFNELIALGNQASQLALEGRKRLDRVKTQQKSDGSVVSDIDLQLHQLLRHGLKRMMPAMRVISEEDPEVFSQAQPWQKFWLIDPLDGTSSFLQGSDEFCINIAYMLDNQPALGMVIVPALSKLYYGGPGYGVYVNGERIPMDVNQGALRVVHSHDEDLSAPWFANLQRLSQPVELQAMASSLKLCQLAAGEADLYPRMGNLMEWDIAAPLALLRAQGGDLRHWDGRAPEFNKVGWSCSGFVAARDPGTLSSLGLL